MACDMFSMQEANTLLRGKYIHFFGDSNSRALYKDLLWLLEDGRIIPETRLKTKNEESHANDYRISNGACHNGHDYDERREYYGSAIIKFEFITRLFRSNFIDTIRKLNREPEVVVINSCVWDITRWGTDGVEQFKSNIYDTFKFLKEKLPRTRIIWLMTLPPSFKTRGGFLTKDIEFMRKMLPWHIVFANKYAEEVARLFSVDILDLHYHFRFLMDHHARDGIHWDSLSIRYATNLLLTHLCLTLMRKLPGLFPLNPQFLNKAFVVRTQHTRPSVFLNNASKEGDFKRNVKASGRISKNLKRKKKQNKLRVPFRDIDVNQYKICNYKR